MSALGDAVREAVAAIQGVAGVSVTYRRDAQSVPLTVTPGETRFERQNYDGIVTGVQARDYLIEAVDLVLGGSVVEPDDGDTIQETIAGVVHTFEVMSPGGDEPAWRYRDHERSQLRVHTKLVAKA